MESEVHAHSPSTNESQYKMRRADQPRMRERNVDQFEFERSRRPHMPTNKKPERFSLRRDHGCDWLFGGCVVRLGLGVNRPLL